MGKVLSEGTSSLFIGVKSLKTQNDKELNRTKFRNNTPHNDSYKVGAHHKCPFLDATC